MRTLSSQCDSPTERFTNEEPQSLPIDNSGLQISRQPTVIEALKLANVRLGKKATARRISTLCSSHLQVSIDLVPPSSPFGDMQLTATAEMLQEETANVNIQR